MEKEYCIAILAVNVLSIGLSIYLFFKVQSKLKELTRPNESQAAQTYCYFTQKTFVILKYLCMVSIMNRIIFIMRYATILALIIIQYEDI